MSKYHISPTTGRPNICRASVRACPISSADGHYDSADEARAAYETSMEAQTFKSVSKGKESKTVDPRIAEIQARCVGYLDSMMDVVKEKSAIIANAEGFGDGVVLEKLTEADRKSAKLMKNFAEADRDIRVIKSESSKDFMNMVKNIDPVLYYSDRARAVEVCARTEGKHGRPYQHFSRRDGHLNPMQREGTGAMRLGEPGENSFVILAESDGSRPRAISAVGEQYEDPEEALGEHATHVTKEFFNDRKVEGLRVVGYVNQDGERFGWIPNRKIPFCSYVDA